MTSPSIANWPVAKIKIDIVKALCSFDHIVGASEQRWRHSQPERLGCRDIDGQVKLSRLLNRYILRPRAAENLVDDLAGTAENSGHVRTVGDQASGFRPFAKTVHARQARLQREG